MTAKDAGFTRQAPIRTIAVEGLHGRFTYEIPLLRPGESTPRASRIFAANEDRLSLLYGANGTGKTTLLRMLFNGLSAAPNRSHRHALSRIKFRRFVIEFEDESRVEYERPEAVDGGFVASVTVDGETTPWDWAPNRPPTPQYQQLADGQIVMFDPEAYEQAFLGALASLDVNPVFLTDARNLVSDLVETDTDRERGRVYAGRHLRGLEIDQVVQRERDADLRDALMRVREYLRGLVLTGAQRGSERSDTVYARLLETIIQHAPARGRPPKSTIPGLEERVRELDSRVREFTRFALLPTPPVKRLLSALDKALDQPSKGRLLEQVLTPYLDGLSERMDELESGRGAIAGYVDTIDAFLEGKSFGFTPARGVGIRDDETGEDLDVSDLSSGEKQILVLFSDVVALRERSRLFIIDEPELSLNPEWQRKLMPALLASTEGSPMQLVAATHSIEIMAKYQNRLRPLPTDRTDTP